jgi:hypothetical protein
MLAKPAAHGGGRTGPVADVLSVNAFPASLKMGENAAGLEGRRIFSIHPYEASMHKKFAVLFVALPCAAAALAAGDIPTRYSGSFPSTTSFSSINGTFTGRTLALTYTFVGGTTFFPSSANLSCTGTSPTQTRCSGPFRTDDGRFKGRLVATVTWKAGQPVAIQMVKN